MRLLTPKKDTIDWGKVKLKDEIDKALTGRKSDPTQNLEKVSFQKELHEKIGLLEKITRNFEQQAALLEERLSSLNQRAQEAIRQSDGFAGLLEGKFRISKEEVDDKVELLRVVSEQATETIELLLAKKGGMESSLQNIENRINDLADHDQTLREGNEEYRKQRAELNTEIIRIISEHKKFQETQREFERFFNGEFTRLQELLETLKKDKLQAVSTRGEFEKLEHKVILWQATIEGKEKQNKLDVISAQGQFGKLEKKLEAWEASLDKREAEIFPKADEKARALKELVGTLDKDVEQLEKGFVSLGNMKEELNEAVGIYRWEKNEAGRAKQEAQNAVQSLLTLWNEALAEVGEKGKELEEVRNEVKKDDLRLKTAQNTLEEYLVNTEKWRLETSKTIKEFNEIKKTDEEALLRVSSSCNQLFDGLSKKMVELQEHQVLSEKASKELIEVRDIASKYMEMAYQERKELAEAQEKERVYFDKRKQEIEEAERILFQDKLQIQSAKEYFDKLFIKLEEKETKIKSDREAVNTAFQELKNASSPP